MKDQYDEWLARVVCYAFSVSPSPFVSQVNRATSESLRVAAAQEGLVPLKTWVKTAMDHIVQVCLDQPDLEFAWVGDDVVDPLQQAQTQSLLVGAGIKTRDEARAELGLAPEPMAAPAPAPPPGVTKYSEDQPRDESGRWTSDGGDGTSAGTASSRRKPPGIEVASINPQLANPGVASDIVPAQEVPERAEEEPKRPRKAKAKPRRSCSTTPPPAA